jgi:ribose 5-phosphate isomerase A
VLIDHDINQPARVRQADRGLVRTDGGNLIYDMAACKADPRSGPAGRRSETDHRRGRTRPVPGSGRLAIIGQDSGVETLTP